METVLLALAVLACPVGMGLMMWCMAKGIRGAGRSGAEREAASAEELRAEARRLADRIEQLEARSEAGARAQERSTAST